MPPEERETSADPLVQDIVDVTNFFEGMGIYAKHGLADQNVIFDFWSAIITGSWERLTPAIAIMRRTSGPLLCENFQYLAAIAQRFLDSHPYGAVPRGASLAPIEDVWLEEDRASRGA